MEQEILNIDYNTACLVIKAVNASKNIDEASKKLGMSAFRVYKIIRRNKIKMMKDKKGVPYIEKGGEIVYRDHKGKIYKEIIS